MPVDLRVDRGTLDREFDVLTRGLSDYDRAELSKRVNIQAIMYNEKRIHKVCAHIAKHFTEKIRPNGYKADEYKAYRRNKDEEAKVLDRFRDPGDPLEIVIVTSKLLTGFDAPILQVMYLDKPMKEV